MSVQAKNYTKMAIFFLLVFGIGFLPAPAPLTSYGMKTLGIFIGLIYGWCAIGMIWPSIVGILAMAILGILPMAKILANGWGSTTMVLIFFMMMISKNLEKAGISNFIALWFISRKLVMGRPWLFSYAFLIAIALISTMTSAVATILLGWGIFYGVASEIKAEKYSPYTSFMVVGIVVAASLGNGLFPFRTVGAVAFALMTQISGEVLNNFVYTIWAFAMCFALMALYIALGKYLFRVPVEALANLNEEYFATKDLTLSKRQKTMLVLMFVLIALMLLPSITPATWITSILFKKVQAAGIAALICLAMCLISVEGTPLMEPRSIIREGISWDVMFLG
ncbi:MAG: anion permease, partial [Peptococcaceae bacterium]|nr:anion permease [Peptococcaceae bacterium]